MSVSVALYAIKVPGDGERIAVHNEEDDTTTIHLTMAAIDPDSKVPHATLKIHRLNMGIDDDEDEDELEDDAEEDDDQKDEEIEEEEFILSTLVPGKLNQQTLDLTIQPMEAVFLSTSGKEPIYVTGNYTVSPLDEDDLSDEDGLEDDYPYSEDDEDIEDDEDKLDQLGKIEELVDMELKAKAKSAASKRGAAIAGLDLADDDDDDDDDESSADQAEESDEEMEEAPKLVEAKTKQPVSKREQKRQAKKVKVENGTAPTNGSEDGANKSVQFQQGTKEGAAASPTGNIKYPKDNRPKRVLDGGLILEDYESGTGPAAKSGQKIGMRYIGKLENGKVFDSNTKGSPFYFTLGKGDVIKGWDQGVKGLKLNGKRKITVPPAMGYGSKAQPGIPANSKLIFEVKMVALK